jgi:hypothetical protein
LVTQVGKAELGRGPSQADRADDQAQSALLGGEHVRDRDPDTCPAGIAPGDGQRHRSAARFDRWNWGTRPRRASNPRLAAEQ